MSPADLCRLLLCGQVRATAVPELGDPAVRAEVEERLATVGAGLRYAEAAGCWLAVLDASLPDDVGVTPIQALNDADRAVAAAGWLHLVWLPAERRAAAEADGMPISTDVDRPGITEDDLHAQFSHQMKRQFFRITLGKLRRLGFFTAHEGRLQAGPLLEVLGDAASVDEARRLVATHKRLLLLRAQAEQITADLGLTATPASPDEGQDLPPEAAADGSAAADPGPLARRLRQARSWFGLSQHALAERANVDVGRVSRIERGEVPPPGVLAALADALGLDLTELTALMDEGSGGAAG